MRTIDRFYAEIEGDDSFDRMTPDMISEMSDKFKRDFAKDLLNGSGDEMRRTISLPRQEVRFKKPLKVRYSDFKEKLKNKIIAVFGL